MSCSGCTSRGYVSFEDNDIQVKDGCNKLDTHDWLNDIPDTGSDSGLVEIRFKNTRKDFFRNVNKLPLKRGEIVAVEAQYGHDIGIVSLTGRLAEKQFKLRTTGDLQSTRKLYRKASPNDISKWKEAQNLDYPTMVRGRQIINELELDMKLSDVEFQGDKTKAIFYYISERRVDFRKLIKVLADTFRIRVEMKQIGARQEAALIGGIGSCGRELCCSTWKTNFTSVPTHAAKFQELSSNAQKLAGQCSKLKCCLMYELDSYLEAWEQFPKELLELETIKGVYYPFKVDVLKKRVFYSAKPDGAMDISAISTDRIKEIINLNKRGKKPESLKEDQVEIKVSEPAFTNTFTNSTGEDSIDRFSNKNTPKRRKKKPFHKKNKFRKNNKTGQQNKPK